jgi:hypothetical protein
VTLRRAASPARCSGGGREAGYFVKYQSSGFMKPNAFAA